MRQLLRPALLAALLASGGCSYWPIPPDPIRYVTSPSEVSVCRRLGSVGLARTDGVAPYRFDQRTTPVPGDLVTPAEFEGVSYGGEVQGPNFAIRQERMRDAALALGATDLLLSRRIFRDWSYVEGIAFLCRR